MAFKKPDAAFAEAVPAEATPPKPPATVEMVVKRDYWDANAQRVAAGTIIEIDIESALAGVESGALGRVK